MSTADVNFICFHIWNILRTLVLLWKKEYAHTINISWIIYYIYLNVSWDPSTRLTPEEALQHEWIKEGLVHRRKDQGHSKHSSSKHQHGNQSAHSDRSTDPYKTPAQPPVKEKSKTDEWKLNLKKGASKKEERIPPVGASAEQSHDEIKTHRGKSLHSL